MLAIVGMILCLAITSASALEIVSRKEWGASAPTHPMRQHSLKAIIIHHTGIWSRGDKPINIKIAGLQRYSQREKYWADVPYHFYIGVDGKIAEGRSTSFAGDTNTRYDTSGYLQIVLEGNFNVEYPSPKQIVSLREILKAFPLPVKVHSDHAKTDCPGKNFTTNILSGGEPKNVAR